ncbi:hypothetical protein Tco_1045403 [Tanacetum coccineum]|uniref:MAK10-like protein n=1 Tax=Tanacetum coccineum TaxID=301880 RepID=A0ABQ5GT22_9ASTR
MENENPIRTLGDYFRRSHGGYQNTIELPGGNNVVPLRSDTIRLVQNGCSFHRLRSEDPNQHLKGFLKLVDSLDLDVANKERTRLRLFQFSLRDQANNLLECESLSKAWTRFKDLLQNVPHYSIDLWLQVQIFYDHVNRTTRRTIDQSDGGKLRDKKAEESWALLEDLALYDNKSWNDPRDFAKPVKEISLPQDVSSTSDRRLIKIKNQVQRLMEAHLAPKSPIQVNKIASSCEICSGPQDTQYCMENPEQAFVEYASSRTNEVGGEQNRDSSSPKLFHFINTITILSKEYEPRKTGIVKLGIKDNDHDTIVKVKEESEESEEEGENDLEYTNPPSLPDPLISFITKKVCKLNSFLESFNLVPPSSNTQFVCTKENDGDIMFVEIIKKYNDSSEGN